MALKVFDAHEEPAAGNPAANQATQWAFRHCRHLARGVFLGVLLIANAACDSQSSEAPGSAGATQSGGATSTGGKSAAGGAATGGTTAGTGGVTNTAGRSAGGAAAGGTTAGTGGVHAGGSGGAPSGGNGGSNDSGGQGVGGTQGTPFCTVHTGDTPCEKDASCLNDFGQSCGCGPDGWTCGNI